MKKKNENNNAKHKGDSELPGRDTTPVCEEEIRRKQGAEEDEEEEEEKKERGRTQTLLLGRDSP